MQERRTHLHPGLIVVAVVVTYIISFFVFAREYHTSGLTSPGSITMPVWRVEDTAVNHALIFLFTPMRKLIGPNDPVEWL